MVNRTKGLTLKEYLGLIGVLTGVAALVIGASVHEPAEPKPYRTCSDGRHPIVISYGKDGVPGGEGEDADMSSEDLEGTR